MKFVGIYYSRTSSAWSISSPGTVQIAIASALTLKLVSFQAIREHKHEIQLRDAIEPLTNAA